MDHITPFATLIGIVIAFAVVMPMLVSSQRKKVAQIEPMLRERGGMTLDEIAAALKTGIVAKGYLMQALDQMAAEGKLTKTPPPAGHPRMRIVRDTKYSLPT
jgi:hypothetical protein